MTSQSSKEDLEFITPQGSHHCSCWRDGGIVRECVKGVCLCVRCSIIISSVFAYKKSPIMNVCESTDAHALPS